MQVPAAQWYPDKIQPSPEGRNDTDTGDAEAIVVDPAGGEVATDTHTVVRNTLSAKKRPAEDRSNLVRNMSMHLVSQGGCMCLGHHVNGGDLDHSDPRDPYSTEHTRGQALSLHCGSEATWRLASSEPLRTISSHLSFTAT
jgi:hypothetical protein